MSSKTRIAVIGAGAGGLCVARHFLADASRYDVVVFEQASQVGGTWVYSDVTGQEDGHHVHSSMYANVRTNLPKEVMAFPDFPFDEQLPSFLGHQDVLEYLQTYSCHFSLQQHIRFSQRVVGVRPLPSTPGYSTAEADERGGVAPLVPGADVIPDSPRTTDGATDNGDDAKRTLSSRWVVTTAAADSEGSPAATETSTFDAIFVCNGHYFQPVAPSVPGFGNFRGKIIHSHDYKHPDAFSNQVVIVVGSGASGQDICLDVARSAASVLVSASSGKWIKSPLPDHVQMRHRISHITQAGAVVFTDGVSEQADVILWCTGYAYSFPFLDARSGVTITGTRCVRPLYKHLVNAVHPSMFFIGIPYIIIPFPLMDRQALYAKAILDGRCTLPSTTAMLLWQEEDLERRKKFNFPLHYSHFLSSWQWDYISDLSHLADVADLPLHYKALYNHVKAGRSFRLASYRSETYRIRDDEEIFDILDT